MKKEILAEASKTRTFGFNRIVDGVYPIVKMATYNESGVNNLNEAFEYEVLAVFFDEDETALKLNGLHKTHKAYNEDGTNGTHDVKACGTFFDNLFREIIGKSFYDACVHFNKPETGFVGKFIGIKWNAYRSTDPRYTGCAYYPQADIFATREEAEAWMQSE